MTDLEEREISRIAILMLDPSAVFVFGSNRAGVHGAGAAATAVKLYGAVYGQGEGLQGRSYALPTKDEWLRTLPLHDVAEHIKIFLGTAMMNPHVPYAVTRVGCGLAGYTDEQIAPLFADAPLNCHLPEYWESCAVCGVPNLMHGEANSKRETKHAFTARAVKQADGEPGSR